MQLHRVLDAGVAGVSFCGGTAQGNAATPRLTPRAWLDRRWQQQQRGSRGCSRRAMSAASGTVEQLVARPAFNQSWHDLLLLGTNDSTHQAVQSVSHAPVLPQQRWPVDEQLQQGHVHQQQPQHKTAGQHAEHQHTQHMRQDGLGQGLDILHSVPATSGDGRASAEVTTAKFSRHPVTAVTKSAQLMQDIKAARGVWQLHKLYRCHREQIDAIHCASMLNRLAHLCERLMCSKQGSRAAAATASVTKPANCAAAQRLELKSEKSEHINSPAVAEQQQHEGEDHRLNSNRAQLQQADRLLCCLLADFVDRLPSAGPRQTSSVLWVIAKFSRQAAANNSIQQAAAALLQKLLGPASLGLPTAASDPGSHHAEAAAPDSVLHHAVGSATVPAVGGFELADVLGAHADVPGGQQQQERRRLRHQLQVTKPKVQQGMLLSSGNSTDVANTVWALGRLSQVLDMQRLLPAGSNSSSILDSLQQLCCYHLHVQKPDGTFVSSCLVGFARLGHPVPELFKALAARAGHNYISKLQSHQVVSIAWACAKLGHYDAQLFSRLLWRAVVVRQQMRPQGVSLLLWAAGKLQHAVDPRAASQLLQVWKAVDSTQLSTVRGQHIANLVYGLMRLGQLQEHRAWFMSGLLQLVMQKLDDLQPVGIATVLAALVQVTKANTAAAGGADVAGHKQWAVQAAASDPLLSQQPVPHTTRTASRSNIVQGPASTQGALAARPAGPLVTSAAADYHPLVPLYREISKQIAAQLPDTRPNTLFHITSALARAGYYDARLYMKLEAAAAAVIAGSHPLQDGQPQQAKSPAGVSTQLQGCSVQQMMHLVCIYARYQQPAPALWAAALPHLTAAARFDELQLQQLVVLLSAARGSGCEGSPVSSHCLLQLAQTTLRQQAALSTAELAQAAASAGWLLQAIQQNHQDSQRHGSLAADVDKQLRRLVPRLVSAVLSHPYDLPAQHIPQLLELAAVIEQRQGSSRHVLKATVADASQASGSSSSAAELAKPQQLYSIGVVQLQRLADLAVDQLGLWQPPALVALLSCHIQDPLFNPVLADAYAEELLSRIEHCSVQTLVRLLQVLAAAGQASQGYSHSQLVAVTARQLHGRLLLACELQLRDAVEALRQLGQHESAVCKAASRLLLVWSL